MSQSLSTNQGPVIEVSVVLNAEQQPVITYSQNGQPVSGNVVVNCGENITYQLVGDTGFSFLSAGFLTPFDQIIHSVLVSGDGQQLTLIDDDCVAGTTKFQFIFTNTTNNLLLLSPDPQVINKDTKPPL
jgi:hypothetical protein